MTASLPKASYDLDPRMTVREAMDATPVLSEQISGLSAVAGLTDEKVGRCVFTTPSEFVALKVDRTGDVFRKPLPDEWRRPALLLLKGTFVAGADDSDTATFDTSSRLINVRRFPLQALPVCGLPIWAVFYILVDNGEHDVRLVHWLSEAEAPTVVPKYSAEPGLAGDLIQGQVRRLLAEHVRLDLSGLPEGDMLHELDVRELLVGTHDSGGACVTAIRDNIGAIGHVLAVPGYKPKRPRNDGHATSVAMPAPRMVKGHEDAEAYVAEVVRALGFRGARKTAPGPDGGIDVVAEDAVAQVKMEALPTGAPVVQALYGVAMAHGKKALFFSLAGYTTPALEFAEMAGVACFEFGFDGSIVGINEAARGLLPERAPADAS